MRVALLNTGTELLLGDVENAHLRFIAGEIFTLGLRIEEQRTVPDGPPIRSALADLFTVTDILFVTGGLGPTSDDITRDLVADFLGLKLEENPEILASLERRLKDRGIRWVPSIARQAEVPAGGHVLPNESGSAPGLYLASNINPAFRSPHIFLLPGPPAELQPMFRSAVVPILRSIVPQSSIDRQIYKIACMGESIVEEAIGAKVLAISDIELGYCARPGEVDVRIVGAPGPVARADKLIRAELGASIFSTGDETLEQVLVELLRSRRQTLAVAESCTGGLLAHRLTNIPGSSEVFLAGYVVYANDSKIRDLNVDERILAEYGAVSDAVARAMAEGARIRAGSTYALATTGIAGPSGGSGGKPVGTVYVALATPVETIARKLFFPGNRQTFKELTAQAAFEWLRRKLIA